MSEYHRPIMLREVLNGLADRLLVVKGNCDSDVDTLISDFEFVSEAVLSDGGKRVFLQHGDRFVHVSRDVYSFFYR